MRIEVGYYSSYFRHFLFNMNQLIKVETNSQGQQLVSARELHQFLQNTDNVNTWFKRQIDRAMLIENEDFTRVAILQTSGQTSYDYAIKLSAAKELAMLNGGEKGKQARLYFIECEKKLMNTFELPKTFSEALMLASKQAEIIEQQNAKIAIDAPKVEFYDEVASTSSTFDFQEASAMLKLKFGRNILFKKLREANVLMDDNLPFRKHIDSQYFIVIETKWVNHKTNTVTATKQTRLTQKGLDWLQKNKPKFKLN